MGNFMEQCEPECISTGSAQCKAKNKLLSISIIGNLLYEPLHGSTAEISHYIKRYPASYSL